MGSPIPALRGTCQSADRAQQPQIPRKGRDRFGEDHLVARAERVKVLETAVTRVPVAGAASVANSLKPANRAFGMRFALDLIWLDKNEGVVRVDREAGPWRMRACPRARSVIETVAGQADAFLAAGLDGEPS